ncbi:MAG: hypothetical protein ACLFNZ_10325 [Spirochaetaceae bacterium]
MSLLVLALCCICTVELLFRSGMFARVKRISSIYKEIIGVFSDREAADSYKEEVLPKYAGALFLNSVKLLAVLAVVFSPFIIALGATLYAGWDAFYLLLSSLPGILGATAAALLYGFVRRRYVRKS